MLSADTNLFIYAANPDSPRHGDATQFFAGLDPTAEFVIIELVLVEIYMQLRNPAVLRKPLNSADAAGLCFRLRSNPNWQHVDYGIGHQRLRVGSDRRSTPAWP
jgi:predicted nucleic acid-binding protein